MGLRYVLQLLSSENKKIIAKSSITTKAREKVSTYLEYLEIREFFDVCLT